MNIFRHLTPEQRPDKNGKLVVRHVKGDGTVVMGRTFPPASMGGDQLLRRAQELSVTDPESVNWVELSPEQVKRVADNANGHIEDMAEPERIYDVYTAMINGGLEPQMVSDIVNKERVAERARSAWLEVNGTEEAPKSSLPQWEAKRESYRARYSKFQSALDASLV